MLSLPQVKWSGQLTCNFEKFSLKTTSPVAAISHSSHFSWQCFIKSTHWNIYPHLWPVHWPYFCKDFQFQFRGNMHIGHWYCRFKCILLIYDVLGLPSLVWWSTIFFIRDICMYVFFMDICRVQKIKMQWMFYCC